MELGEYQVRARETDQNPAGTKASEGPVPKREEIIPLLGLVGEVGALLSEYKKLLRDGEIHRTFRDEVAEELGDVLWYVANVADKFDLDLDEVAAANLRKVRDRWLGQEGRVRFYDEGQGAEQQLPRKFEFRFDEERVDGVTRVRMLEASSGVPAGDSLRDNTYDDDGYRFHDVIHLGFAAYLGWSPVLRKLLRTGGRLVSRTPETVDDAEDGGRAQVVEEAIVAAAFIYAEDHEYLDGATTVGQQLLRHIARMTRKLEVSDRSAWEWDRALLSGFAVWRELAKNGGGCVVGDLSGPSLTVRPPRRTVQAGASSLVNDVPPP